jgi:hypothetical protein
MSPIIELKRELLPDPTAPMTQTNSPFLMEMPRSLRMKASFSFGTSTASDTLISSSF